MRIADTLQYRSILNGLTTAQGNLFEATQRASSGRRIGQPSDDPVGAAQAVRIRAQLESTAGYRDTIAAVQGDLDLSESTLATATDLMARAAELALQGANGAMNAEGRLHIAEEVRQIREELIALGNRKGTGGYLFGGTSTAVPPFTTAGVFVGNLHDRVAEVGPGDTAVVSVSGGAAFTSLAGGRDVFADLAALETALQTDNQAAISAGVNNADTCRRQILAARVDAGLQANRLQTADAVHQQVAVTLESQRSRVEDADPVEAYSRFVSMQQGLDQAIAVSRSVLSTIGKARFG